MIPLLRAGALSGILSKASVRYGEEVLPLLAIFTGLVCIGAFALGLDACAEFVPICVMQVCASASACARVMCL